MLSLRDCTDLPSLTDGHHAYAHFYLPHLRGAAPPPGSYQLQTLRFESRDMGDDDCRAIAEALLESFERNGSEQCSAAVLREISLASNPAVTNAGVACLLAALLRLARFGDLTCDAIAALEDDEESALALAPRSPLQQLHTLDLRGLECPLTVDNQLLLVDLIRAAPGLRTVRPPSAMDELPPEEIVSTGNPMFAAEEAAEREEKRVMESAPGFAYSRKRCYTFTDIAANVELNEYPAAFKRVVLAAGHNHSRLRKARLDGPYGPDDIERDFPKAYGGVSCAAVLSNALLYNNSIVLLDFSNNNIGDDATVALADFLRRNATLAELRLRNNEIGTRGGLALNAALLEGPNKTLLELDLSNNSVNDIVVNAFLATVRRDVTAIGVLRLEGNCVTPDLVTRLYQALMLNTQPPSVKSLVPQLERNDAKASKIALNSGEDHLDNVSLKVLLHALRQNDQVTYIDVSNNDITDDGAQFLAEMMLCVPSLRKVSAQFNRIGEEGARLLLQTIPRSKNIEKVELKFQDPPIDPELLTLIEKVAGLSSEPQAVRQWGLALTQNDPDVTALDLSLPDGGKRCNDDTIGTLAVLLQYNTFFCDLNLSCNAGRLTCASMPTIASIGVRLNVLNLSACDFTDADVLQPLCSMLLHPKCKLHTLLLEHNDLTSETAKAFIQILRDENDLVTTLSLTGNKRVSKEDKETLQYYCDLNTHTKAFKSIVLSVERNQDKRIKSLDFCFVDKLNSSGTSHGFRKEFGDLSAQLLCKALSQNDSIQTLNMCGNRISDVGAAYFAKLLRSNVTLTHLDLSYNELTDEGLTEMLKALRANTTVKVFLFEGNKSKNLELSRALQQALHSNKVSVGTPYTTAMNMTGSGAKSELGVDPRLQQYAVDRMVGNAILEDALVGLKQ